MSSIIRPSINLRQQSRWHPYPTTTALEHAVVQIIQNAAKHAISERGEFLIVLAGGTTPRQVYERLQGMDTDWSKWHIYFGDERCLPANNAERNSHMAAQSLLNHVDIPISQIFIIPSELGAIEAAQSYAKVLKEVDLFDLVILGLGEDGHTASLFPQHQWGNELNAPATLAIQDAPKPPAQRVSLTAQRLSQTRQLLFIVTGASKKQAVTNWRKGENIPASAICPITGVDVYIEDNLLSNLP